MLCTVVGIGRYNDPKENQKEKCALYVAYERKEINGQATRALMLDSAIVGRNIAPGDVVDIIIDFNGNIESVNEA